MLSGVWPAVWMRSAMRRGCHLFAVGVFLVSSRILESNFSSEPTICLADVDMPYGFHSTPLCPDTDGEVDINAGNNMDMGIEGLEQGTSKTRASITPCAR
jgi:hypothetical protein